GQAHRGGTLRLVSAFGIDSVDPALAYTPLTWSVLTMTNDGLVGFRRVGGIQGIQLVPDLATSLPVAVDNGRTYTFRLRPDIQYSNGKLVQPEDFRRGIERLFEIKQSPGATYFTGIVGTSRCGRGACDLSRGIVTDKLARTVTFHLTAPDADFLTKLALTFADAVPVSTPGRPLDQQLVPSTGPYMVAAHAQGQPIKLVRNPNFREWSADAQPDGYPDVILWRDTARTQLPARIRAFERGAADAALQLAPPLTKDQLDVLATRYPGQLRTSATASTNYFFLNTRVPPFDDLRARRAVNFAFDRQGLVALVGRAFAPTCQLLPPNYPSFRKTCPYVPNGVAGLDKARRLVRASGTTGQLVTVWTFAPVAVQGRFMVSVLKSLGYRARLHVVGDPQKYFGLVDDSRRRVQVGYFGWVSDFPSESSFIEPAVACSSYVPGSSFRTSDPSGFCSHSLDRLLRHASAVQALNAPAARVLWQRAERLILAQAPIVPAYNKQQVDLLSKRVGNYQYHPQWGALVDQLWVR
ncbi:MAG: hypothetical protein QOD85_784, partial [Gaiellaceae bacterium]|nr:hypothetical protein [Gaiellaceae bacterium]